MEGDSFVLLDLVVVDWVVDMLYLMSLVGMEWYVAEVGGVWKGSVDCHLGLELLRRVSSFGRCDILKYERDKIYYLPP